MSDKQRERPGVRKTDWYRNHLTAKQRATGIFSGGRIFNFKEGWAKVIGTWGKAHYFKVDEEFKCEDPTDKLAVSSCGGFNNPRGALRVAGLIEYRGDRLALTEAGRQHARFPDAAPTNEELQRRVLERLPGPERKLLTVALGAYPDTVPDADLAERTGYAATGGGFNNPKGRLRSLGLVTYPASKCVRAADILFPFPLPT